MRKTLKGISTAAVGLRRETFGRPRIAALLIVYVAGFLTLSALAAPAQPYWQLTFSYDAESLSLIKADRIAPMRKEARTPGLAGAALRVAYELEWLDAKGGALGASSLEMPLGLRVFMNGQAPCQTIIPKEGAVVARVQGPKAGLWPSAIRLTRSGQTAGGLSAEALQAPRAFAPSVLSFSLPAISGAAAPPPGPVSVEKTHDTGDDSNRFVAVVMGDGYTSANLTAGRFTVDAASLMSTFAAKAPWDAYWTAVNTYRIDIESNEEGADQPPPGPGIYVDTYLNASFWVGGTERLLALDSVGLSRAFAAADSMVGPGVWDEVFVVVNSTKYGGSGGAIAVTSVHASAREILPHEVGHSFAGLADEYDYGRDSPPANDHEPNVDFHFSGPDLKWLIWVEGSTPLPTPNTSQYDNVVGAFEGAKYYTTGIYRPWRNCLMRNLFRELCPVCQEAHVLSLMNQLDLADGLTPPVSQTQRVGSRAVAFTIDPLPIDPLTYTWSLGGLPLPGETSSTLTLDGSDLGSPTQLLEVEVAHPTPRVRSSLVSQTYSWPVVRYSAVPAAKWSDY